MPNKASKLPQQVLAARKRLRRQLQLEKLEHRQLLAADFPLASADAQEVIPEPHGFVSLSDYEGRPLSNWRELLERHGDHDHGHDHQHDFDHDHNHDHDLDHDFEHESGCTCRLCAQVPSDLDPESDFEIAFANIGTPSDPFEAAYKWPQSGLGSAVTVTYSYSNLFDGNLGGSLSEIQLRSAVEEAFGLWASYAPLHFVEVDDAGPAPNDENTSYRAAGTADIRIGHHGMDGRSGTLAHAYYPTTTFYGIAGDVHLDSGESWKIGAGGGIDALEVLTHEFGHALGLGHESSSNAIMNPYYGGRFSRLGTGYLLADDINGIRALYGNGVGSVVPMNSNAAPIIEAVSDQRISRSQSSLAISVEAVDPNGDALQYSASAQREGNPIDAELSWNGSILTITPPAGFVGSFEVTASVSDGELSAATTFDVSIENAAPILDAIADQQVSASAGSVTVSVFASDPDGDAITLDAEAFQIDEAAAQAHALTSQYEFTPAAQESENHRGHGEKYFYGEGRRWFYILPNGEIYRWTGSIANGTHVGTVDPSYHADLTLLYNAESPTALPVNAQLQWQGRDLIVSPPNGFSGEFDVMVRVSDGAESAATTFTVNVVNHAPTLTAIADRQVSARVESFVVDVLANDVDGDSLAYTASAIQIDSISQQAHTLQQRHRFTAASREAENHRGHGEKYFYGEGRRWFFILPNGDIHRFNRNIESSPLIGSVDGRYHEDLSLLFSAEAPAATPIQTDLTWNSNQLTVAIPDGFVGEFEVLVEVSDGRETASESFAVTVANHAPVLSDIGDHQVSHRTGAFTVAVVANDADGDPIALSAEAFQFDDAAANAYALQSRHQFSPSATESHDHRGLGEKYFFGEGRRRFYILPSGAIHRWSGRIQTSPLIGTVDPSYHADLSRLYNAQPAVPTPVAAQLTWAGSELTVTPPSGFEGSFDVTVTASDGRESDSTSFSVLVANNAPVLSPIGDMQVSHSVNSFQVNVSASDADADPLTFDAEIVQVDRLAQEAYRLRAEYNFTAAARDAENLRGQGEKYFYGLGRRWFYILPGGEIHRWTGNIRTSPLVGTLDAQYHRDLDLLFNATEDSSTPLDATTSWNGTELTVTPPTGFVGNFNVMVRASDGITFDQESFAVTVTNLAPTISDIPDQSLSHNTDVVSIPVTIADGDGDDLDITLTATAADLLGEQAYELDQRYQFRPTTRDYLNARGLQEKYFRGNTGWFYILPDGEIYQWGGSVDRSTQVGELDSYYYADLDRITLAELPERSDADIGLTWNGTSLQLDPSAQFRGAAQITVSANDGVQTTERTFEISVSNSAPEFANVPDVTMLSSQDSVSIDVDAQDRDGDEISLDASVSSFDSAQQKAFELRQNHRFVAARESYNARGHGEKYFRGTGGWFFILPNGEIYRWRGRIENSSLIDTVDTRYHADLRSLLNVQAPAATPIDANVRWAGDVLTIDRPLGYAGTLHVTLTASAGGDQTSTAFNVVVEASDSFTAADIALAQLAEEDDLMTLTHAV